MKIHTQICWLNLLWCNDSINSHFDQIVSSSQNECPCPRKTPLQSRKKGGCYSRKYIKLYLHFIGSCSIFLPLFRFQISLLCQHFWGPNSGTKWVICNYLKSIYEYFHYRLFFLRSIGQFFTQIYMNCFVSS